MYKYCLFLILAVLFSTNLTSLQPKPFPSEEKAEEYLTTHYNWGCDYYNAGEWKDAANEFEKVIYFFPDSQEANESFYFLGISYYGMHEYDFASAAFTNYLNNCVHPPYFEDVMYYKFAIAQLFKCGVKKHPFDGRYIPKIACAHELAITIYDEIVAAFPNHDLTIRSLFSKAELLIEMKRFRAGIETYQMIIRRFPEDERIPECFMRITHAYYRQSKIEFQNPDIYGLAELNTKKFSIDFPREDRLESADIILQGIEENFARGFSELGGFYERTKNPGAAIIYYRSAIEKYPNTSVANFCRCRLAILGYDLEEVETCEPSCKAEPKTADFLEELQQEKVEAQEEINT